MDIPWGDERTAGFVTNVGLITSDGPNGPDIMAAEWTYLISYLPGLIAVLVGPGKASHENIRTTEEFGVSIASSGQNIISNVAGSSSGRNVDKVSLLKEMGYGFYPARRIRAPMVAGAAMNAECRLAGSHDPGDHTLFVGEIIECTVSKEEPLLYRRGRYWRVGEPLQKPDAAMRERIGELTRKYER